MIISCCTLNVVVVIHQTCNFPDFQFLAVLLLRWLTLVVSLRFTSPYSEFYEEILNIESPSDFWGTGVEEDQQGGNQVEVFYLEGGGGVRSKPGVVRIDLETFKLDSQLVRDQVRELLSRTFGDSKLPDVSTLTTLVGPSVGVNNSRSAGFCLKINSRVENLRLNKKVERTLLILYGEVERSQSARGADGGSEREPRRATQDSQGDHGHNGRRLHLRPRVRPEVRPSSQDHHRLVQFSIN